MVKSHLKNFKVSISYMIYVVLLLRIKIIWLESYFMATVNTYDNVTPDDGDVDFVLANVMVHYQYLSHLYRQQKLVPTLITAQLSHFNKRVQDHLLYYKAKILLLDIKPTSLVLLVLILFLSLNFSYNVMY